MYGLQNSYVSGGWGEGGGSSLAWTEDDEKTKTRKSSSSEMNVDGEGTGGVNLAAVAGIAKAKQIMKKGSFKKRKGPKMDTNKALSLMQFTSTREFADRSMGLDPKKELDKKHFTVMMNILKKKKAADKDKDKNGASTGYGRRKQMSAEDEVRMLHEAYQFLLRKFVSNNSVSQEEQEKEAPKELDWSSITGQAQNKNKVDNVEKMEEDNDDVFEVTKSEDEDFEREMAIAIKKPSNLRRAKSSRGPRNKNKYRS